MAWMDSEACAKCGGDNPAWCAPSPLWNAVMRGGSIDGDAEFRDLVCIKCFMALAEAQGIARGWRLTAVEVSAELETVTPSGRVWNEQTWLWDGPATSTPPVVEEGRREADFDLLGRVLLHLTNDVQFVIQNMSDEDQAKFYGLVREIQTRLPTLGAECDADATPVAAQGDEVREALQEAAGWMHANHDEGCNLDLEYGSGRGKCTCGLDEAIGRVNAALATLKEDPSHEG